MDNIESNNLNYKKKVRPVTAMQLAADLGKLPPQAVDVEEAVLGAIMLERNAISNVLANLSADCFYKDANCKIYQAMSDMFALSQPIDILTVTQELKKRGELEFVGGPYYISQLTNRVASSANIEFHARIILQKFIARELIRISTEIVRDAYEDTTDVLSLLEKSKDTFDSIGMNEMTGTQIDAKSRMNQTLDKIRKGRLDNGITGVPCGIAKVDRFTGGFQNDDLIFIGARPGNYKTALIMAFAHKCAPLGFNSYISQQEMGVVQSGMRELAMHSGINTQDLRRGMVTDAEMERLENAAMKIASMNVFINHTGGVTLSQIKANVKRQNRIKRIDILFIDYLQLLNMEMKGKQATEESIIAATTRKMKLMAKSLGIPVVALSQLNREVEKRPDKRPMLSDFKGSGAIEADADVAIVLFNPAKYFDNPTDKEGNSLINKVELIFCKNRQGAVGSVLLNVNPATNQFDDDETAEESRVKFNPTGMSVTPMPKIPNNLNNNGKQAELPTESGDPF